MLTNQIASKYPLLSEEQAHVVGHVHGPLLVLAGPGAGKTTTLVLRAANLVVGGHAKPCEVILCTFTQKAAAELKERFDRLRAEIGCREDLSEVVIGTIHSICARILKEGNRQLPPGPDLLILDSLQQTAFIQSRLNEIASPRQVHRFSRRWGPGGVANGLANSFNTVSEGIIDPESLVASENALHEAIGECYIHYTESLHRERMVDFSYLQRWAMDRLRREGEDLPLSRDLKYLMVDEYQDTNPVQEQLVLELARPTGNVAVVGDDDQAIYGFRGATVRNLLEFPNRFPDCEVRLLTANYRSESQIVSACDLWMREEAGKASDGLRREKPLSSGVPEKKVAFPSILRIQGNDPNDEARKVARMVACLKNSGVIERYDQVAVLLNSVQERVSAPYVSALQESEIPVQLRGERTFFRYREVKDLVACFALILGWSSGGMTGSPKMDRYVVDAIDDLLDRTPVDSELRRALRRWGRELADLSSREEDLNRTLLDYLYVLLALEPFLGLAGKARSMVNLATWSRLLATFQTIYGYEQICAGQVDAMRRDFMTGFLPLAFNDGVASDAVSTEDGVQIMTVHGSKGLEFPVVIAGGLTFGARDHQRCNEMARYAPDWDPGRDSSYARLDGARHHYVAFTRAKNLLVMASSTPPAPDAPSIWTDAADWNDESKNLMAVQRFPAADERPATETYSVTGDILIYDECPRRYEYFGHYGFARRQTDGVRFGLFVHGCMEQVAQMLADGADPGEVIREFQRVVDEGALLDDQSILEVQRQVDGFLDHVRMARMVVLDTEAEMAFRGHGWEVKGRADLLVEAGSGLAVLDFKSGEGFGANPEISDRYRKQLALYGFMAQQSLGRKVEGLGVYWLGPNSGQDMLMAVADPTCAVNDAGNMLLGTVERIRKHDFTVADIPPCKICRRCELLTICKRDGSTRPVANC